MNAAARRRPARPRGIIWAARGVIFASMLGGCGGAPRDMHERDTAGLRQAGTSVGSRPAGDGSIAATVDGQAVTWDELRPVLVEAAGGAALEEVILDRLLSRECAVRGLVVTAADVASERALLVDSLGRDAQVPGEEAERLLATVRQNRGLGEVRFAALLRRNAMMRALVRDSVQVDPAELDTAYAVRFGPRLRARVILVAGERDAGEIRSRLEQAGADRSMRFAEEAARASLDPSSKRGGLLDDLSPADPSYPPALGRALASMEIGELSPVLAVDRGYALALLEGKIPAQAVPREGVEEQLRAEVRVRKERLAMDDLARRMLRAAGVTVMDRGLEAGWKSRPFRAP